MFQHMFLFGISPQQLMLKIWCTLQEPFSSLPQKFSLPTTAFLIPNAPQAHGELKQISTQWCQEKSWMTLEDFDRFNVSISKIYHIYNMGVSKNNGTPKSSILIGCSIINHPFWGTPIFGNTYIYMYTVYFYIILIISISEHLNNPTVNSQALPEELLDDPPGYRLWTDHRCASKKQPSSFQWLNSCAAWDQR